MNRLFLTWVFLVVTSQLSSAVILRPKWFPYFRRGNQGGSGRGGNGGGSSHHSGRPTGTLATRQARTVGFVDLDPNTYRASQQLPAYLHSMIRSNIGSSSIDSDNYNLDRNSRSSSSSSISHEGLIPRCRSGQTSAECLSRVLRRVGQMLEMERDRRTVFADDYYSV